MKLTPANIKMWSSIGSRATYGLIAMELAKLYPDLYLLTGDTSTSAGLQRFKNTYPEKLIDVGIAEQNMLGVAAGLANEGNLVFASTFSPFMTLRCCEQIKMNMGYMGIPVKIVGLASGVVLGALGYSHCSIEDVAIMRSIGGMTVISPADCGETAKTIMAVAEYNQPVYIRLTGGAKAPIVYQEDYDFKIGKAVKLKSGNDISLFSCGPMVSESLKCVELLSQAGISVSLYNMHTIRPIDKEAIVEACQNSKVLFSVEEHSVIGGLGSAIAEFKTTLKNAPSHFMMGLPAQYGKCNHYQDLLQEHELLGHQLAERIKKIFFEM